MQATNLDEVKSEIERRVKILVAMANDPSVPMDRTDRRHIKLSLGEWSLPDRPDSIPLLLKHFVSSSLSYAVIRKQLTNLIGQIPTASTIAKCLELEFNESAFKSDDNWLPANLNDLAKRLQDRLGLSDSDLMSKTLRPRVIVVLLDGSSVFETELRNGLDGFYSRVDAAANDGAESAWNFAAGFAGLLRR